MMFRLLTPYLLLIALLTGSPVASRAMPPEASNLSSPMTTMQARADFLKEKRDKTIGEALAKPLSKETEKDWQGAFWAAELIQERTPTVRDAIADALKSWHFLDVETQRQALETAYALYQTEFRKKILAMLPEFTEPKHFAMATYYLLRTSSASTAKHKALALLPQKFPKWEENGILIALHHRLTADGGAEIAARPPLADLLAADFAKGKPVAFSFQRQDRRYPGLAAVKQADGKFARRPDGSIFAISQLALAMSNLPGTITNGNTPQGIFTVNGTGTTENVFMGPTPFLVSALPMEVSVGEYFHDTAREKEKWSAAAYDAMLPESWKNYFPIHEAWNAGLAGRSEILVHGTTVDPEFTKDAPFYPGTPSLGCLCAFEAWSPADGKIIASDQLGLLAAFARTPEEKGYLVVVNLDAEERAVTLYDVLPELLKAEE
ncbi:MAG: hypothetical protein ABI579_02065 [Candidatus Sumerlaeota bacterium]